MHGHEHGRPTACSSRALVRPHRCARARRRCRGATMPLFTQEGRARQTRGVRGWGGGGRACTNWLRGQMQQRRNEGAPWDGTSEQGRVMACPSRCSVPLLAGERAGLEAVSEGWGVRWRGWSSAREMAFRAESWTQSQGTEAMVPGHHGAQGHPAWPWMVTGPDEASLGCVARRGCHR